jgi:hypothetical protein
VNRLLIILATSFILSACNSSDDENSIRAFEVAAYREMNATVSDSTLTGTWVASWDIQRNRSNQQYVSVPESLPSKRLEILIIRQVAEELEISYCGGDFDSVTVENSRLVSAHKEADILDNKSMTWSYSRSNTVSLGAGSYDEDLTVDIEFIKISDSVNSFGDVSFNWSDVSGVNTSDIQCAAIERFDGGNERIYLANEHGLRFLISNFIDPTTYDAYIKDENHSGGIANSLSLGEQDFSYSVSGPLSYGLNYQASNYQGLSVVGDITLSLEFE